MTYEVSLEDQIDLLVARDPRYKREAYFFVLLGLSRTGADVSKRKHVSGGELLAVLRELAVEEYGLTAPLVLDHWGVKSTLDFGEIVFQMVGCGLMGKTEEDTIEDFREVFDLRQALEGSFTWGSAARG